MKSLEDMVEQVKTSKGEKPKFFQVLEEYRSSKGPPTKAIDDEVKLDIFGRWMANQLCSENGGYTLYMWVTFGVESMGL